MPHTCTASSKGLQSALRVGSPLHDMIRLSFPCPPTRYAADAIGKLDQTQKTPAGTPIRRLPIITENLIRLLPIITRLLDNLVADDCMQRAHRTGLGDVRVFQP